MKHKAIKERGLEQEVKDLFYKKNWTYQAIADKLDLSYAAVYRYIRDANFKNYSDEKLEAIAMTDEFTPMNVIQNFFQSVHHASKELAFTAILNQMYREELARVISEEGIEALTKGDNYNILSQWYQNSRKLDKLIEGAQKQLEGYINLFSQVLDVQREVSYVKIVTDLLRKEDPELYRKLQRALDADPESKRVLEALSREDVIYYWDGEVGKVKQKEISEVN